MKKATNQAPSHRNWCQQKSCQDLNPARMLTAEVRRRIYPVAAWQAYGSCNLDLSWILNKTMNINLKGEIKNFVISKARILQF